MRDSQLDGLPRAQRLTRSLLRLTQSFHCRHGKAYLFNDVVNVTCGGARGSFTACEMLDAQLGHVPVCEV